MSGSSQGGWPNGSAQSAARWQALAQSAIFFFAVAGYGFA
jgi:hypothetical protein